MSDARVLAAVSGLCERVVEAGNPNHFSAVHVRIEFAEKILNLISTESRKTCSQILVGKPNPCSIHGQRCFEEGRFLG